MKPTSPFAFLVAAALTAAPLVAQGNNATELSNRRDYNYHNDIWGFVANDGREFAVVGNSDGTAFYDCSDPANPVHVKFINGPDSTWRDMKTYDDYCYVVTEGGSGMQVIDVSNPDNPVLVRTWGTNHFSNAHNIQIDVDTGIAYACGTNNGTVIIDLAANPSNPVKLGNYTNDYVHDLHVQDGYMHNAEIYAGQYQIVQITNPPTTTVRDSVTTPGNFTHSAWVNEDNTVCVTTDEVNGGRVAFYDCSNVSNIQFLSSYTINSSTIPHNAFIKGDRMYASWYTEGFVCLDISNPSNPQLVANLDLNPSSGGGYVGTWGCYPFQPSGVIYMTDQDEGFFVIAVDDETDSDTIDLAGSTNANTGQNVNYTVTNAPANSPAFLHYSLNLNGTSINGQIFDIGDPIRTAASGTTNGSGSISWTVGPVPSNAGGVTAYVEAQVDGPGGTEDSNVVTLTIN